MSYNGLYDFSHLPKTGNYVTNLRGMNYFTRKPQPVGRDKSYQCIPKINFQNCQFLQSIRFNSLDNLVLGLLIYEKLHSLKLPFCN